MNLYEVTAATLAAQLNVSEVPEAFVVIAKHQVLGLANEQIAETLGCEPSDILECEQDELFKQCKQFIGGIAASEKALQTTGWDAIESTAIQGLMKRLHMEKDTEFLLKVAAVANRATRRTQPQSNVLDPTRMVGNRTITLTQRLVSKITDRGEESQELTKQVSIKDGTMGRAEFSEIDSLLNVRAVPVLEHSPEIRTRNNDPTIEDLTDEFMRR